MRNGRVRLAFMGIRKAPPLPGEWVNPRRARLHHAAHKSGSGVLGAVFAQPDAGAFPVFVNKDHPGRFERGTDSGNGLATGQPLPLFKVDKRSAGNARLFRYFALFLSEKGAGGSALGWSHVKSDLKSEFISDMVSDITTHKRQRNDPS